MWNGTKFKFFSSVITVLLTLVITGAHDLSDDKKHEIFDFLQNQCLLSHVPDLFHLSVPQSIPHWLRLYGIPK